MNNVIVSVCNTSWAFPTTQKCGNIHKVTRKLKYKDNTELRSKVIKAQLWERKIRPILPSTSCLSHALVSEMQASACIKADKSRGLVLLTVLLGRSVFKSDVVAKSNWLSKFHWFCDLPLIPVFLKIWLFLGCHFAECSFSEIYVPEKPVLKQVTSIIYKF